MYTFGDAFSLILRAKSRVFRTDYDQVTGNKVMMNHRGPAQSVWVADCYFIVNVLDLPFASPIAIYR